MRGAGRTRVASDVNFLQSKAESFIPKTPPRNVSSVSWAWESGGFTVDTKLPPVVIRHMPPWSGKKPLAVFPAGDVGNIGSAMIEIWYVEDYMSGQVMENKYYSTHAEATTRRNELGYGLVKSLELQDGGVIPRRDGSELVAFRVAPGEKIEIS
jgi:hypothetical protein